MIVLSKTAARRLRNRSSEYGTNRVRLVSNEEWIRRLVGGTGRGIGILRVGRATIAV